MQKGFMDKKDKVIYLYLYCKTISITLNFSVLSKYLRLSQSSKQQKIWYSEIFCDDRKWIFEKIKANLIMLSRKAPVIGVFPRASISLVLEQEMKHFFFVWLRKRDVAL